MVLHICIFELLTSIVSTLSSGPLESLDCLPTGLRWPTGSRVHGLNFMFKFCAGKILILLVVRLRPFAQSSTVVGGYMGV